MRAALRSEKVIPKWIVHHGDCLDRSSGLASLPDKSVDHCIMDPPYEEGTYARTRTNRRKGGSPEELEVASNTLGIVEDIRELSSQLQRVVKRWLIVFHDTESLNMWRNYFPHWYVRSGIWVKVNPMPQVSGDRPGQGHESIFIAHCPDVRKRWNGGGRPAVWPARSPRGEERPAHPCPKPLDLMEKLIADFTDPGDLVLDPYAGSGTTGLACKNLGRRFIGWEIHQAYAELARERIGEP